LREARAASAVRHPNVIEIYDFLELEDGSPVMVMELLSGEPLANRLRSEARMPLREAASVLLQVVAAVGSAHAMGIIHRDLKPENIFLRDGSIRHVKVLDFGIAKLTAIEGDFARSTDLTASGAVLGTPCYVAPEQVFGEREIDHRVDIWALGLILYECLSGVLPTRADNLGQILRIIATGTIPPLRDLVPDVPPDVADLVGRMLSREYDVRPTDLRQVADILARHAGASAPSFGPPLALGGPLPDPPPASKGRHVALGDGDADALTETADVERTPANATMLQPQMLNNLPLRRLFVGRKKELSILDVVLKGKQRTSLFALAGVGKTALALEYAHRAVETRAYPGGMWWILAEGPPLEVMIKLVTALRAGAPALLAHVRPEAPAEEQAEAARIALQNHPLPSLLVLDNVSELGLLERLPGGAVRVLATLRDRRLALGELVELEPLNPGEARALVEALASAPEGDAEAEACDRVIHGELGGLAVAVEVAAKAAKEWARGWVAYEGYLAERMAEVLDDARDRSEHYPGGVFAALDLSIDRCVPGSPERTLLEGAAVFAPDGVPLAWVYAAAGLDANSIATKRALATLEGLGLSKIDRRAETASMHRLVHKRVEHKITKERWLKASYLGAACVAAWMASAVGRTRSRMEEMDTRRAHIEEALRAAERVGGELKWIRIANGLARHLRYRALYGESREWSQQALAKIEQLNHPDLAQRVASLSNLALALQTLGEVAEARSMLERALAINEESYGPNHPDVATSLSNLAAVLQTFDEAGRARPLLERALVINENAYGSDHPDVATSLSNLAAALQSIGEADKARPLLERALAIDERIYGPDHPNVATILSNLAMVLRGLGDTEKVQPLLERALAIDEKIYGPDHPEVAKSLSKLASVLRDLRKAEQALPLLERALDIDEKIYGPNHPNVARSCSKLAEVLRDLGEAEMAHLLFQRALTINNPISGPAHPSIDTKLSNLTLPLQNVGGAAEALPMLERELAMAESTYGRHHREVASALSDLAMVLRELGEAEKACLMLERAAAITATSIDDANPRHPDKKFSPNRRLQLQDFGGAEEARLMFERALAIAEKSYGPHHMEVANALSDLAMVLKELGEAEKARVMFERALTIAETTYGPHHVEVANALSDLAMVLKELGEAEKARPLLVRAMVINEKAHDPNHPEVAQSLSSLAEVLQALGEAAEARRLFERALAIDERFYGPDHPMVAGDIVNLMNVLRSLGEEITSSPILKYVLTALREAHGPDHPILASCSPLPTTVIVGEQVGKSDSDDQG
jgi:tetratricopeptide (TPR) repeat protein